MPPDAVSVADEPLHMAVPAPALIVGRLLTVAVTGILGALVQLPLVAST